MPTLQTSGAISLANLQTAFGGSNPISLSEYYRNGSYVDGTQSSTTRQPSSGAYYHANNYYWYIVGGTELYIVWNGSYVAGVSHSGSSYTTGGWTYYRSAFQGNDGYGDSYSVYRTQTTTSNINTNVPTSGTISLDDFYGATY